VLEREYQARLIKRLHHRFPGCIILKNDTDYIQGIPDLTILYKDRWAMLEVKASVESSTQANQEYYVYELDKMSYAAFIWPANEVTILDELKRHFRIH
jgi:hypothetical protein